MGDGEVTTIKAGTWMLCLSGHRVWKAAQDIQTDGTMQPGDVMDDQGQHPKFGAPIDPYCPQCGDFWFSPSAGPVNLENRHAK